MFIPRTILFRCWAVAARRALFSLGAVVVPDRCAVANTKLVEHREELHTVLAQPLQRPGQRPSNSGRSGVERLEVW